MRESRLVGGFSLIIHLGLWLVLCELVYVFGRSSHFAHCWHIFFYYVPYLRDAVMLVFRLAVLIVILAVFWPRLRRSKTSLAAVHVLLFMLGALAMLNAAHAAPGEVLCL